MFVEPSPMHEIWDGTEVEFFWDHNVCDDLILNLLNELVRLQERSGVGTRNISALTHGRAVAYRPGYILHHAIVGYRGCNDSVLDCSPLRLAPNFVVDFVDDFSDPNEHARLDILTQSGVEIYWRVCVYEDKIDVYERFDTSFDLVLKLNVNCRAAIPPFDTMLVNVKTLLYPKSMRRHVQLPRTR